MTARNGSTSSRPVPEIRKGGPESGCLHGDRRRRLLDDGSEMVPASRGQLQGIHGGVMGPTPGAFITAPLR